MGIGLFIWMGFLSLCVVAMVISYIASLSRKNDSGQQPTPPQKIDVSIQAPSAGDIADELMRRIQQRAAKRIEVQGHRADWRVVSDESERLPVEVLPRLGNSRNEIVRR